MKRIFATLILFVLLFTLVGCQESAKPETPLVSSDESENVTETVTKDTTEYTIPPIELDEVQSSQADELSTVTEPSYYEAKILEDLSGGGEPQNYDDLVDYLESYSNLTFVSYEIVSLYSQDEAYALTESDSFLRNTTLYKVHVFYDHINGCETDYYMNISHAGNAEAQYYGYPVYQVGQRFMSAVFGKSETRRVPVPELEFVLISKDGEEFAYHLGHEKIVVSDKEYANLVIPMSDGEDKLITSTINNPMIFTQKSSPNELSAFIRQDWNARGLIKESSAIATETELPEYELMPEPFGSTNEAGDDLDNTFYSVVNMKLNYIDGSFCDYAGWDEVDAWLAECSSKNSDLTAVDEVANLYSFIKHFNIPDSVVRDILVSTRTGTEDDFTDDEIDLLLSDDADAIANYFAHEYAIVKGKNLYSLKWVYNSSIQDYVTNGLTAEDIESRIAYFSEFDLLPQAKIALENKINLYADELCVIEYH